VLLGLNLPEVALLRAVMNACAGQRVAVLSGIEDPVLALAVLRTGAAGYIPKSSPTEVIIQAILLILAGGIFVPTLLAAAGPDEGSGSLVTLEKFGERARERLIARGLAVRDVDILELLVQGQPNKRIAQALRLSEGTVKVYVTRIMRNLSVRNRTQAAFAIHAARLTREPYQERTA
jgi:DNA-binding NarL/FixJ family response regulator